MKIFFSILFYLLFPIFSFGQDSLLIDKKYREDQLYIRFTYNILLNKPEEVIQKGISLGFHAGFMRDISLTERGKYALGIGLGYAYDKHQSNFLINSNANTYAVSSLDFKKNKFESHAFEIPLELRYRNSSATEYKFWRVYIGGKISYNFASKSIYIDSDTTLKTKSISFLNRWQYGPQISIGYNTWNIYAYWNVNPLFKEVSPTETFNPNLLKSLKTGIQFYIF